MEPSIFDKMRLVGKTRRRLVILGAGGIGSNVLRYLGKCEDQAHYFRTYVHEFDEVELSNLNRTALFMLKDVGQNKIHAIRQALSLFGFHATQTSIRWVEGRVQADTVLETENSAVGTPLPLIVDCRDTIDPTLLPEATWLKASYDGGTHVSWHFLPAQTNRSIWRVEADSTYDITPSFYVPAALSGLLIRMLSMFTQFVTLNKPTQSRVFSMDIDDMILSVSKEVLDGE